MSVTEEGPATGSRSMKAGSAGLTGWALARSQLPGASSAVLVLLAVACGTLAVLPTPLPDASGEADPSWVELALAALGAFPNLGLATLLLVLATAVGLRKRVAWWVMLGYQGLLAFGDVSFLLAEEARADPWTDAVMVHLVVRAACLALLLVAFPEFFAKVRRGAPIAAIATLAGALAAGVLAGWGLIELFPGTVPPGDRLAFAAGEVAGLGVSLTEDPAELGRPPEWLVTVLGFFAGAAIVAAATVLFRSRRSRNALGVADEDALRALVERYGSADSLSYFVLRRDKSVVFGPDGHAAVAYRVEAGVCLASGDPVGDPGSWPGAIDAWLDSARGYGWVPASSAHPAQAPPPTTKRDCRCWISGTRRSSPPRCSP